MPSRLLFRMLVVGAIAALAASFQWSEWARQRIDPLEHVVRDMGRQYLASSEPEPRVLVVDIDEASLANLGPWPWPRHQIADLVETLLDTYKAKAVGLDIVFPTPAPDSHAGDQRLAALGEHASVVFAQAFDFEQRETPLRTGIPVFTARKGAMAFSGEAKPATGFVANHAALARSRCVGNIGIRPDTDGRIRRVPLWVSWQGQTSPLLPLAMLSCAEASSVSVGAQPGLVGMAKMDAAAWEVPFVRQPQAYTVISASEVLSHSVPEDALRGRWILVGSSALGLNDRAATPLSSSTAGVMVHASALTSLLDWQEGRLHGSPESGRWQGTLWIVITMALLGWSMNRFKAWVILPMILSMATIWAFAALWGTHQNLQFSILSPLLGYLLVMLLIPLEWWFQQREQGQILRSFATYVAPSVLQQMLKEGIEQPLVPKYADITVVSADMQNYTGLTGQGSLQDAATLTREFLQCLTEPVLRLEGTLDKYTGDGLVAFWGAPVPNRSHAAGAIEAGIQMVLRVRAWNEERIRQGMVGARVRIGIETGPALVGDLGTPFRSTYTAVGDCINLASKLQAAARPLRTDLVVGPVAAEAGLSGFDLVPIASEILPGKKEAVVLWTIRDLPSSLPTQP